MPITLSDEEYGKFKEIIGSLLVKLPSEDEKVKELAQVLPRLWGALDKRALPMPPLGDQPAFPLWSVEHQTWMPGMTYRQWLIGKVLPEAMRYVKGTPNSGNPGESSTFFNSAVEIAVLAADMTLVHLETEKQIAADDEARKEGPDAPPA